ncbi:MAG: calcium-binding protein [Nocardioidaceae bacterium]
MLRYPNAGRPLRIDLRAHTARVRDTVDRVFSIEDVRGTKFADVMRGDQYFQFMSGFGGNDLLSGRGGPDFLFGDSGDDTTYGGNGNDVLNGGVGTDTAYGGPNGREGDYCSYFEERHNCEH